MDPHHESRNSPSIIWGSLSPFEASFLTRGFWKLWVCATVGSIVPFSEGDSVFLRVLYDLSV